MSLDGAISGAATGALGSAIGGALGALSGAPPKLERAYIDVIRPGSDDPNNADPEKRIAFHFNPAQFSRTVKAKFERGNQPNAPESTPPQYLGTEPETIQIDMFLDDDSLQLGAKSFTFDSATNNRRTVVKTVAGLLECVKPTQDSLQTAKPAPPWVVFRWGEHMNFEGHISSVSITYTRFSKTGTPIRANCKVTIESAKTVPQAQNPTSGAKQASRSHKLISGDSLPSVAYRSYQDAGMWRLLAEANDIDDPLRITPGRTLLVPPANRNGRAGGGAGGNAGRNAPGGSGGDRG